MKYNDDKNIYDMLNDIDIDLSEYDKEDFNDIEKIKIKKKFIKSIKQKNTISNNKKNISIASAIIISLGIISVTPIGTYASKIISDLVFDIKSALKVEIDYDNHINVINKSVTKEDLTLRLNEALLNDNELIVSMSTILKEKIPKDITIEGDLNQKLYVNGEFIDKANSSSAVNVNKNNIDEILHFNLDTSKYSGVIDIKVELEEINIYKYVKNNYVKEKTIKGPFVFEFDLDTTRMNKAMKNIELNKVIEFGNNQNITLNKFVYTPLTQKINYTKNEEAFKNEIELVLKGFDDLGNEVIFERNNEHNGAGSLITNFSDKQVKKSAKYLTLTAYEKTYERIGKVVEEKLREIKKNIKIDLKN